MQAESKDIGARKVTPETNQIRRFAVAVRDGTDLFLYLTICRGKAGDVYVNFPRDFEPDWKPHSSYHATGQHHQKSFDHKALLRHRQKPDTNFRGTENVVITGIASDEPRSFNSLCEEIKFQAVFEIPCGELSLEKYRTFLSVDLAYPIGEPVITPGAKVLRQAVHQDAVPWIIVTLFDTGAEETGT